MNLAKIHIQLATVANLVMIMIIARPLRRPERSPSVHKRIRLAHKLGSLVAIRPNGLVRISPSSSDKDTLIKLWPYGGGFFRIQGETSGLYIAMNSKGHVYTTTSTNEESLFRHKMTPSLYHTFESNKYRGFYLGFRKRTGTPSKGNRTSFWKKTAHFLVYNSRRTPKITKLHKQLTEIWKSHIMKKDTD